MKLFFKCIRWLTLVEVVAVAGFFIYIFAAKNPLPKEGEKSQETILGYEVTHYTKDQGYSFYLFAPEKKQNFFLDIGFALFEQYQHPIYLLGENEEELFWISILQQEASTIHVKK